MDKLITDRGTVEISNKVHDLPRAYAIDDWQSEPHHQHQNFTERKFGDAKRYTNTIMNRTGAPASTWLLCLQYVCLLLNRLAVPYLNWRTPLEKLTGQAPDISALMQYHFWELVYYHIPQELFPFQE